jgi:cysteine desulfurase
MNGHRGHRLPGNLSLTIPDIDAADLVEALPDVAISGSACTSGQSQPSHVLTAIGLDSRQARTTVRISLGRFTTEAQVEHAAQRIIAATRQLMSLATA